MQNIRNHQNTVLSLCYSTAETGYLRPTSVENVSPCWYCTTWCQKDYHISTRKKKADRRSQAFPIIIIIFITYTHGTNKHTHEKNTIFKNTH